MQGQTPFRDTPEFASAQEWLADKEESVRTSCLAHMENIYDELGWLPQFDEGQLWYRNSGWYEDEVLIYADGSYTIYYMLSLDEEQQDCLCAELDAWSSEMSEDGNPHSW